MKKLAIGLATLTAVTALLVAGFTAGSFWGKTDSTESAAGNSTQPGVTSDRTSLKDPPPPPEFVPDTNRVKESLKEGKTYVLRTKGALNMRATDKDWGFATVCTVNFGYTAVVERTIEKNDGSVITELRHFKEVKSIKMDSNVDSVRLELGTTGDFLLGGLLLVFKPDTLPYFAGAKRIVENAELRDFLAAFGADRSVLASFVQKDPLAKAFTAVGGLQGKKVRLVYRNDPDPSKRGVISVTPVAGDMTGEEKAFHMSSSLLSDSLIFPDGEVKVGDEWEVDGINFMGLLDPELLAYAEGKVRIQRAADQLAPGRAGKMTVLKATGGELTFHKADTRTEQTGHFKPTGELHFSPTDQMVVKGRLKGSGKMNARSKNHLLFEARSDREPTLEIDYTCTVQDAPSGNR